jgi:hypothetical protein
MPRIPRALTLVGSALLIGLYGAAEVARGQSTAPLATDPGSTATMTMEVEFTSFLGTASDSDTDTAPATGTSVLTLFPTSPPFSDCIMQTLDVEIGELQFSFRFLLIVTADVTVSNLRLLSTNGFPGTIDGAGNAFFPTAVVQVMGDVHLVSAFFGLDENLPLDATLEEPLSARITESGGVVTLDGLVIPLVAEDVSSNDLPDGVEAAHVTIDTDASNVVLQGPYSPAWLGDHDADGDIDLDDYAALPDCLTGPDVPATVLCTLFDFNDDADVDLMDVADFQVEFTGFIP